MSNSTHVAFLNAFARYYGRPADLAACWVCQDGESWLNTIPITLPHEPPAFMYLCAVCQPSVPIGVIFGEAERARLSRPRRTGGHSPYDDATKQDYLTSARRLKPGRSWKAVGDLIGMSGATLWRWDRDSANRKPSTTERNRET